MSKLEEKFRPHVKTWDCYNDVPLDENHAAKCVEITEQECIGFKNYINNVVLFDPDLYVKTDSELFQLYQKSKEND